MAFMAAFFLATLGIAVSIIVGLLLLPIPKLRGLSPYAFLIYPSTYIGGLGLFCLAGLFNGLFARTNTWKNSPDWFQSGSLLVFVLTAVGAGILGALSGAVIGAIAANHLWWRFFASEGDKAAYPKLGWLAMPPIVRRSWHRLSIRVRAAWKGWQSAERSA